MRGPRDTRNRRPRLSRARPPARRRLRVVAPQTPTRRPFRLTGRAVVLALAIVAVGLSLAHPLSAYLAQRSRIHALEEQQRSTETAIAQLKHQQQLWADPTYVAAQARERLHFVLPGETAYVVIGAPPSTPAPRDAADKPAASTWSARFWSSVVTAGRTTPARATRSR